MKIRQWDLSCSMRTDGQRVTDVTKLAVIFRNLRTHLITNSNFNYFSSYDLNYGNIINYYVRNTKHQSMP